MFRPTVSNSFIFEKLFKVFDVMKRLIHEQVGNISATI